MFRRKTTYWEYWEIGTIKKPHDKREAFKEYGTYLLSRLV
jgi:hypothetical protein